ncbi:MAG TPA: hypothetical protein VMU26_12855 [Candidatus Polarisedimenticolia bacterium]|nr:hypothetical protein [Candidatus Polarisedimenticolia bacterium]
MRFRLFQTGGSDRAVAAAQNQRDLRQQGYTVRKTIDCLIATFSVCRLSSTNYRTGTTIVLKSYSG